MQVTHTQNCALCVYMFYIYLFIQFLKVIIINSYRIVLAVCLPVLSPHTPCLVLTTLEDTCYYYSILEVSQLRRKVGKVNGRNGLKILFDPESTLANFWTVLSQKSVFTDTMTGTGFPTK